jgi:hypothetical protein
MCAEVCSQSWGFGFRENAFSFVHGLRINSIDWNFLKAHHTKDIITLSTKLRKNYILDPSVWTTCVYMFEIIISIEIYRR